VEILPAPGNSEKGGAGMAIRSDAQRRAVAKYNAENYDRVELRLAAGQKNVVKAHASGRTRGNAERVYQPRHITDHGVGQKRGCRR